MKNKTLLIIFLGLFAVWGLLEMFNKQQKSSFKAELIAIDTAQVTTINVYPKSDEFQELTLQKENGQWIATQGTVTTPANIGAVNSLLGNLNFIKTKRVAAKRQEKWADYEVEETSGSRIKVYAGTELLEDFIVGRFSFNQQTRQGVSFVRITKEDEVYAVDGFLSMTMGQGFDAYRNKNFLAVNQADVTQITVQNNDGTSQAYANLNGQWSKDGTAIDSTIMATYLTTIQNLSGSTFVDDVDETQVNSMLYKTMTIAANNLRAPITIKCYRDPARELPYLFQSSQNEGAYFGSAEDGLFEKLFGGMPDF